MFNPKVADLAKGRSGLLFFLPELKKMNNGGKALIEIMKPYLLRE